MAFFVFDLKEEISCSALFPTMVDGNTFLLKLKGKIEHHIGMRCAM